MRTVLVTGGCGFIGSHFVRLMLARTPWRVINLDTLTYAGDVRRLAGITDDDRYRFVRGDISDAPLVRGLLQQEHPWAVVNFAAESHVDRSILDAAPFIQTNVLGVQVLLDACRALGGERFVQISTDEVYGDREGVGPATEESALRPGSPYAATKAAADLLCLAAHRAYDQPIMIVRSTNNYGPFQYPEKLIPLMVHQALTGQILPIYGDGMQIRDWLHVEDTCDAILRILESGRPGAMYNAAGGNARANVEVVDIVCRVVAREAGLAHGDLTAQVRHGADRPGHDRVYSVRDDLLRTELGWRPAIAFDEGLQATIRWYVQHHEWLHAAFERSQGYFETVYPDEWGRKA